MKKSLLLSLLLALCILNARSQTVINKDSFVIYSDKTTNNSKIDDLLYKSFSLIESDPQASLIAANDALNEAEEVSDQFYIGTAYDYIGIYWANKNDYKTAEDFFTKALVKFKSINDITAMVKANYDLAHLNELQGKYNERIKFLSDAMSLADRCEDLFALSLAYTGQGNLYSDLGDLSKSLEFFFKALNYAKQPKRILDIKQRIGNVYSELGDNTKAKEYYYQIISSENTVSPEIYYNTLHNLALILLDEHDVVGARNLLYSSLNVKSENTLSSSIAVLYINLAETWALSKNIDSAEHYFDIAEKYLEQSDDQDNMAYLSRKRGEMYTETGNFSSAYKYLINAYDYYAENEISKEYAYAAEDLADYYMRTGDLNNAYRFMKKVSEINEKLSKESNLHAADMAEKKVMADKEADAAKKRAAEQEIANSRLINVLISGGLLMAVIAFFVFKYRQFNKKLQQRNRELHKLNTKQRMIYTTLVDDMKSSLFELTLQIAELENETLYNSLTDSYKVFSDKYNELLQDIK